MANPSDHDPSQAPGLPEIQDEATQTPMWIPALGLVVFLAGAAFTIFTGAFEATEETPAEAAQPTAENAPAEAAGE